MSDRRGIEFDPLAVHPVERWYGPVHGDPSLTQYFLASEIAGRDVEPRSWPAGGDP